MDWSGDDQQMVMVILMNLEYWYFYGVTDCDIWCRIVMVGGCDLSSVLDHNHNGHSYDDIFIGGQ